MRRRRPGDGDPSATEPCRSRSTGSIPLDLGLARATLDELRGGDASVNAEAIRRVVAGDASPHRDIALLNSAAALDGDRAGSPTWRPVSLWPATSSTRAGRPRVLDDFIRVTNEASEAERTGQ